MRSALIMAAALDPLGAPPAASNDYVSAVKVPWGMYGNDTIGDCTACDAAHSLMLRTANAGQIVVPAQGAVIGLYSAVSGYVPGDPATDLGATETAMCDYLAKTGFLGHKADAVGSVDPANLTHLQWCIQLFGSCTIGLNLPAFAEDQFSAEQPWDVDPSGDQSVAGHDVPLVDYRGRMFTCVTWGALQQVTPAFIAAYAEEAHSLLFFDWIAAQGVAPPGLSLSELAAKMEAVDA